MSKVTASGGDGTQSLEVRKNKEGKYYAKSSAVEGTHLLTDDIGKSLEKGLDDYRNKKLFDFGFQRAHKDRVQGPQDLADRPSARRTNGCATARPSTTSASSR